MSLSRTFSRVMNHFGLQRFEYNTCYFWGMKNFFTWHRIPCKKTIVTTIVTCLSGFICHSFKTPSPSQVGLLQQWNALFPVYIVTYPHWWITLVRGISLFIAEARLHRKEQTSHSKRWWFCVQVPRSAFRGQFLSKAWNVGRVVPNSIECKLFNALYVGGILISNWFLVDKDSISRD